MDAIHKWSDAEIENLVRDVCSQLQEDSHKGGNNAIDLLRKMCGKSACDCTNLTPSQQLSRLLALAPHEVTDYSVGLSIINNYNSLASEDCSRRVLEKMLIWSMSDGDSESRDHFLDQLWAYKGLKEFKIEVLEEFIVKRSKHIEEDIFQLFKEVLEKGTDPHHLWGKESFTRIVSWSSNSARIFCSVTSVLNSFLMRIMNRTNQYKLCLAVINTFILKVKQKCTQEEKDFVFLYPREYHSLVSLLDIQPEWFPMQTETRNAVTQSTVVEAVRQSLTSRPVQTVCILTHFPEWAALVNR